VPDADDIARINNGDAVFIEDTSVVSVGDVWISDGSVLELGHAGLNGQLRVNGAATPDHVSEFSSQASLKFVTT
jgi:hypothetical protein